ncbi:related to NAD dependent epimerase/dehydratase family protein [Fusarium oxysporum]|uniref:Related to NAD dependent epimerase/dehydratase family protein n=1 Tax=Fusarium oxysporum TaxID=5507 RepID=A0A2H3T5G9_FUSOX|nr:related to NAD dependent epimerase/dehydratase family protein [Fusarium oxysporum]
MPSAMVTGATGITGSAIVHHLLKDPSYDVIYSFSRSNPGRQDPKIRHVTIDLQGSAQDMAKTLQGVSAEHIYFCAYLASDDPNELYQVNVALLSNFLQALDITGATSKIKRFILTCGFKQYGVHLGAAKQPFLESDPLPENEAGGVSWPPNFYYEQQRILARAAEEGSFEWIVTLPEDVLGYARGNFMNEATSIGLYCAVNKALPGSELPFPGSKANYFTFNCWTSANLHAKFCLWAATAPKAGNNIFNVMNGDTESFQNLWPRLAARFGCTIPDPMFPCGGVPGTRGFKNYESSTIKLQNKPPLKVQEFTLGISSDASVKESPTLFLQVDPKKWAKRNDVLEAWGNLRDKYHLDQNAWEKATWNFLVLTMGRDWSCVASMSKARKLGWTGTGATGYIGGDFLYEAYHTRPTWEISALVRSEAAVSSLQEKYPRIRVVRGDLDSADLLRDEAQRADIVLHFANCDHEASAKALLEGIAHHTADRPGWYIHTSGTGILTFEDGRNHTCGIRRDKVFNDWTGVSELISLPYDAFHRNVDSIVTATIEDVPKYFKTAIVCPCCIYGGGRGPGNRSSTQVYTMATHILERGRGFVVGEENGNVTWGDISEAITEAAFKNGYIPTKDLDVLDWDATGALDPKGPYRWGSNSRGYALRAIKLLGWQPEQPGLLDNIEDIVTLQQARCASRK